MFAPRMPFTLQLAVWLSWAVAVLGVLLLVSIVFMRFALARRQKHDERFLALWRPLLTRLMFEPLPARLPRLAEADLGLFLGLWNHLHEVLRGDATARLNAVAERLRVPAATRQLAGARSPRRRILGLLALGNLRDAASWPLYVEAVREDNTALSMAGLRALLLTDARRALPIVVPLLAGRVDWSLVRVAQYLQQASPDVVAKPLAEAARVMPGAQAQRLLKYLPTVATPASDAIVRRIAASNEDSGVLSACLGMLKHPEDRPLLNRCLAHDTWFVRVAAIRALAEVADPEDEPALVARLGDREWWVRYRAGQAIAKLRGNDRAALQALHDALEDRYAQDILAQVMGELARQEVAA